MRRLYSALLLTLAAFIWGSAFVAQAVGLDYIGPLTFTSIRSFIGSASLFLCLPLLDKVRHYDKSRIQKEKKDLIKAGIFCGIALMFGVTLQQIGLLYTTPGKAGFLTALYIVIVPFLTLFLGKKILINVWMAVPLAVIGLYFLSVQGEQFMIQFGDILEICSAVAFAFHILIIDRYAQDVDGLRMCCLQFFVVGCLTLIPAILFEEIHLSNIIDCAIPILYTGVLSSGIAYSLQIIGQRNLEPTLASLVMSLESVFAAIGGWLILHQALSTRELFGCIFIFLAIIIAEIPIKSRT